VLALFPGPYGKSVALPYKFSHSLTGLSFKRSIYVLEARDEAAILSQFFRKVPQCGFEEHEVDLIKQSHDAYCAAEAEECRQQRVANAINGDVVTDSESDDPDSYIGLDPKSELAKWL